MSEGDEAVICKHEAFNAVCAINRFEDGSPFMMDVRVTCTECGLPFEFLGLAPGVDMQGASCSVDAQEARLAIVPKGERPNPLQRMAYGINKFDG